jgi:hypothetical protein
MPRGKRRRTEGKQSDAKQKDAEDGDAPASAAASAAPADSNAVAVQKPKYFVSATHDDREYRAGDYVNVAIRSAKRDDVLSTKAIQIKRFEAVPGGKYLRVHGYLLYDHTDLTNLLSGEFAKYNNRKDFCVLTDKEYFVDINAITGPLPEALEPFIRLEEKTGEFSWIYDSKAFRNAATDSKATVVAHKPKHFVSADGKSCRKRGDCKYRGRTYSNWEYHSGDYVEIRRDAGLTRGYMRIERFEAIPDTDFVRVHGHWLYNRADLNGCERYDEFAKYGDDEDLLVLTDDEHVADLNDVVGLLPEADEPEIQFSLETGDFSWIRGAKSRRDGPSTLRELGPVFPTRSDDEVFRDFLIAEPQLAAGSTYGIKLQEYAERKIASLKISLNSTKKHTGAAAAAAAAGSDDDEDEEDGGKSGAIEVAVCLGIAFAQGQFGVTIVGSRAGHKCEICSRAQPVWGSLTLFIPKTTNRATSLAVGQCCMHTISNLCKVRTLVDGFRMKFRSFSEKERRSGAYLRDWIQQIEEVKREKEERRKPFVHMKSTPKKQAPAAAAAAAAAEQYEWDADGDAEDEDT